MDPLTIMLATMAVGTGIQAYSQYEAGKARKGWEEYNQAMAERAAKQEEEAARVEAGLHAERGRRFKAKQRHRLAVAGVALPGSPEKLLTETARTLKEEEQLILGGGRARGERYRMEGELAKARGKSAYRAGLWGAGSSLLGGLSEGAYRYQIMKN